MTLRFAFLMLHEHPYGREMLRILLEKGFRLAQGRYLHFEKEESNERL